MRSEDLRDLCLSFPGSEETFPFGPENSVFKVAGKIFALSRLAGDPLRVSLKCEPALAEQLREAHPAIAPGYHLNKRHWNTVTLDGSLPGVDDPRPGRGLLRPGRERLPRTRRQAPSWRGDRPKSISAGARVRTGGALARPRSFCTASTGSNTVRFLTPEPRSLEFSRISPKVCLDAQEHI